MSYARVDRDRVEVLVDALKGEGFSVFWDGALAGGETFPSKLEEEINDAKAVLVVWTAASRRSHWVREEADLALELEKLIPLRLEPVKPPLGFRTIHAEDFVGWDGDKAAACWQRLALQLSGLTGARLDGSSEPHPQDPPNSDSLEAPAKPSPAASSESEAERTRAQARTPLAILAASLAAIAGLAAAFANDWGLFGGAVVLGASFLLLFQAADARLPQHMKALARRWLLPVKGGVRVSVAEAFNQLFEAVFFRKHLSFRCLWRSALASTLALGLILGFAWLFIADFRADFEGNWSQLLRNAFVISVLTNMVGDYLSLWQTRLFLRWAARGPGWLPFLVVADALLTITIYFAAVLAAWFSLGAFGLPIPQFESLFPDTRNTAQWLPAQWVFVFSILTTFITSVWLWLVLIFGPVAKLLLGRYGQVSWLGRRLGADTHPFTIVGLVVALAIVVVGAALEAWAPKTGAAGLAGDWNLIAAGEHCEYCPEMVVLAPDSFLMGSPEKENGDSDERPQREVTISYTLAVGRYEVTWAEWNACVANGGCDGSGPDSAGGDRGWGEGRRPIFNVSWGDAQAYVRWLNSKVDGTPYRLLSEAEWEYSARAGTRTRYAVGDTISTDQANFNGARYLGRTTPVGWFSPNAFGLYDMHGNVSEWVEDCHGDYADAPSDGTAATSDDCSRRVVRGGSWSFDPVFLRSADRGRFNPSNRSGYIGFRVARTVLPE